MPKSLTFDKTLSHGFSVELIQDLVERCSEIFTVDDILCSFPVFAVVHAMRILEVFQEIFDDIPNHDDLQLPILDTDITEQLINYYGYFDKSDSDCDELDVGIQ